jgi:hypothetical protein
VATVLEFFGYAGMWMIATSHDSFYQALLPTRCHHLPQVPEAVMQFRQPLFSLLRLWPGWLASSGMLHVNL